jgi:hypothetical protein
MVPSCTLKTGEEKSRYVGLAQEIGFSPLHIFAEFAERLVKKDSKAVHLLEKRVINMI